MLPALHPSASIPFHGAPFSTGKQGLTGVLTAVWTVVAIKQRLAFVAVHTCMLVVVSIPEIDIQ
jgi:hypothetical protein